MKLKELVDVVAMELKSAGLEETGASLSLAFSVRSETNGSVSCEFVDAATLSKPKLEEIHRMEVKMLPRPIKAGSTRLLKEKGKTEPVRIRLLNDGSDTDHMDCDDLDTPAIFRRLDREAGS